MICPRHSGFLGRMHVQAAQDEASGNVEWKKMCLMAGLTFSCGNQRRQHKRKISRYNILIVIPLNKQKKPYNL